MKLILVVKADMNDADYVEESSEITEEELEKFKPLIAAIKANKGYHNWETSEYGDEPPEDMYPEFDSRLLEKFGDRVPYGQYGVHTIESIKLLRVVSEETLL